MTFFLIYSFGKPKDKVERHRQKNPTIKKIINDVPTNLLDAPQIFRVEIVVHRSGHKRLMAQQILPGTAFRTWPQSQASAYPNILRTWPFWLFGLLSLFCIGCGGVNPSTVTDSNPTRSVWTLDSGGVSGAAVTADSAQPISGALIEAGNQQAITASDGRYLLGPLDQGDYRVVARFSGLTPGVRESIRVRSGLITEQVNFSMQISFASASKDFALVALSPPYGTDGDEITLVGTGFGTTPGRVTVSGKEAFITDWNSRNDGVIRIRLPSEVETGVVKVSIGNETSHESQALTLTGRPIGLEVVPASAKPGQQVTIVGRNFHEVQGFNRVFLNGLACQVLPESNTRQLVIIVPPNAETGILQVSLQTNSFQLDGISSALLTIPPEVTYLTPQRSIPGVILTLYGTNFGSDKSAVAIKLGEVKRIVGNDILSFSNTKLTFLAPDASVVAPGKTVDVRVLVNGISSSRALTYTAYNPAVTTISAYGLYDFSTVSTAGTLHLPKLASGEALAFVSCLSGDGSDPLNGSFTYFITALLGGNSALVPVLPSGSVQSNLVKTGTSGTVDRGTQIRSWSSASSSPGASAPGIHAALAADAPTSTTFWMIDWAAANPGNPANDVLATATLMATGTHCLIYVDTATDTILPAAGPNQIASWFDGIYETLATACWDGITVGPPEGNVDLQPRIAVFISHQINRGVSGSLVTLGYFNPRDKLVAQLHSNQTEIVYLWDKAYTDNPDGFQGTLAHELQHMMYFNQKDHPQSAPLHPLPPMGSTWVNEGLSVWAEQLIGKGFPQGSANPVSQVGAYLQNPQLKSLNHFDSSTGLGSYGMSYLFIQYLFERSGGNTPGGFSAIQRLERNYGLAGFNELLISPPGIFAGFTASQPATLPDFMRQFGLAMYCDGLGLPTGLPGYSPDIYQFTSFDLRQSFAGIKGLRHKTLTENPVNSNQPQEISGHGFDVIEYANGNGGDVELTLVGSPPNFKVWVLYYPTASP